MNQPHQEDNSFDIGRLLQQIVGNQVPILKAFGLSARYERREILSRKNASLSFSSRSKQQRLHYLVMNLGNLYGQYGKNPDFFRDVNLDDLIFKQRTIYVGIDGDLQEELDRLINSISLSLRKIHASGDTTLKEVLIQPGMIKKEPRDRSMTYGNKMDSSQVKWLNYQYKAVWNFLGGAELHSEWRSTNGAMINLFTPYNRQVIEIMGDWSTLDSSDVRAIVVQVNYPFFGKRRRIQKVFKSGDSLDGANFEITLPEGEFAYGYKVIWLLENGERRIIEGEDDSGILFVDEI